MSEHTTIWRLVHKRHAETAYTTHEPYKFPGRHTPRNTSVIYAAESPSQAILEALLHLGDPQLLNRDYLLVPAQIPTTWLTTKDSPAQKLPGKTPGEHLVLLSPARPDFHLLRTNSPQPVAL